MKQDIEKQEELVKKNKDLIRKKKTRKIRRLKQLKYKKRQRKVSIWQGRDRIKGEMDKKDRNYKVQDNTSTFTKKCLNKTKNH